MELTDIEWLRAIALAFEEAERVRHNIIEVSAELATDLAKTLREIADRLESDTKCES